MKKETFPYYLTKFFAEYLPNQQGASANTICSYRDTFIQLLGFMKERYHLQPEKLSYSDFTLERIEAFLSYLETEKMVSISTRNQRLAAIHAFSVLSSSGIRLVLNKAPALWQSKTRDPLSSLCHT